MCIWGAFTITRQLARLRIDIGKVVMAKIIIRVSKGASRFGDDGNHGSENLPAQLGQATRQ